MSLKPLSQAWFLKSVQPNRGDDFKIGVKVGDQTAVPARRGELSHCQYIRPGKLVGWYLFGRGS
jgi:hypothetical protein